MADEVQPTVGMMVYTANEIELGSVRGFDDNGFFMTTHKGLTGVSVEYEHAGYRFDEVGLMWRCSDCDETGSLDELLDAYPNCGVERE